MNWIACKVRDSLLVRSVVGLCFDNTSSHVKLETGRLNVSLFLALHSYFPLSFQAADFIMRSDLRLEKPSNDHQGVELRSIARFNLPQMDKNIFCSIPIYRAAIFEPRHLRCRLAIHFTHNPHTLALLHCQVGRHWFYWSTFTCNENEMKRKNQYRCIVFVVACVMDSPWIEVNGIEK